MGRTDDDRAELHNAELDTARWRACAPLLPEGGCEAVRRLCDEIDRLRTRRDELLALVARISQTEPLPDEVRDALAQRGALLSELGTLRARERERERQRRHQWLAVSCVDGVWRFDCARCPEGTEGVFGRSFVSDDRALFLEALCAHVKAGLATHREGGER